MENYANKKYVMLLYTPALLFMMFCLVGWVVLFVIGYKPQRDPMWVVIGFAFIIIINAGVVIWLYFCRITIGTKGIFSCIPGSKHGRGSISWKNVRDVGIFRTIGGERLLFVSTIPRVWESRNIMRNDLPLNQLIKLGYSKKRIDIIKQFYDGEIVKI